MPRKLSRGEFFARQKADAWAHAQNPELANRQREERIERAIKAAGPRVTKRERAFIESLFS
jgi:hypothetical protein